MLSLEDAVLQVCAISDALVRSTSEDEAGPLRMQEMCLITDLSARLDTWTPGSPGIGATAARRLLDTACSNQAASSTSLGFPAVTGVLITMETIVVCGHPEIAPLLFSEACIQGLVGSFTASALAGPSPDAAIGDTSSSAAKHRSLLLRAVAAVAKATIGSSYGRSREARTAPVCAQHFGPLLAGQRVSAALVQATVLLFEQAAAFGAQPTVDPVLVATLAMRAVQEGQAAPDGFAGSNRAGALAVGRALARLIVQCLGPGHQQVGGPNATSLQRASEVLNLATFLCHTPGNKEAALEIGSCPAAMAAVAHQLAQRSLDRSVLYRAAWLIELSVGTGGPSVAPVTHGILSMNEATAGACAAAFTGARGRMALQELLRAAACRESCVEALQAAMHASAAV